ncbi:DUF2568 domain-containing protein [Canibacter zhoujuaniae]|uniref:DUF2568 domain-containing protein n=1 Tax=Canibacter zhoujuaniae TaxID=2708343 RepID=UPI001422AA1C|nr:DUF2568 domain-containing protein [Canibacter zhoujuaniae]
MARTDKQVSIIATIRTALDLVAVVAIGAWGLLRWPLPLPGIAVAVGAVLAAVVVWALFLSPRPVLHTDRYVRALLGLVFSTVGAAAALNAGASWFVVAPLLLLAFAVSYMELTAVVRRR